MRFIPPAITRRTIFHRPDRPTGHDRAHGMQRGTHTHANADRYSHRNCDAHSHRDANAHSEADA